MRQYRAPCHPSPAALAKRRLGTTISWSRDFSIVFGASGLAVAVAMAYPAAAAVTTALLVSAAALSTLSGAALGFLLPMLLRGFVRRVPLLLLMGAAAGLGAVWGGISGYAVAAVAGVEPSSMVLPFAAVGLMQLGWLWLPYTWIRLRRRSGWPLALLGAATSVPLSLYAVMTVTGG